MVSAMISISEHANRVLEIVKAKFDLKTKSEAINVIAKEYEEQLLEPQLRPDFVERMKSVEKEQLVEVKDFRKRYAL